MLEILKAHSQEEVQKLFEQIQARNENGINSKYIIFFYIINFLYYKSLTLLNNFLDWLAYYKIPWVLGSLTYHYSLMSYEAWQTTSFDTNIAVSAHAMINRMGKSLNLKTAILK